MEKAFHIKPTKTQSDGFLGTLLASIGIPMAIDLVKNMISGKGAPRIGLPKINKTNGKGAPSIGMYTPLPPFYSLPPYVRGKDLNNNKNKKTKRKGLLLGSNSPFNNIAILGAIL